MSHTQVLLKTLFSLCLFSLCASHSYLAIPYPYSSPCRGCSVCPVDTRPPREIRNILNNAHLRTWRRKQVVTIKWTKNNHNGGFVRFSFVKISDSFNASAHNHFAFYQGCWEQGKYDCKGRECGTDKRKHGFHRSITVPSNLPDGVYNFAFMWYGGVEYTRQFGKFPDYVSCAYIRVRGGARLTGSVRPYFKAGDTGDFNHHGKCFTSATQQDLCRKGCPKKKAFYDIPNGFKKGQRPARIFASEYLWAGGRSQEGRKLWSYQLSEIWTLDDLSRHHKAHRDKGRTDNTVSRRTYCGSRAMGNCCLRIVPVIERTVWSQKESTWETLC